MLDELLTLLALAYVAVGLFLVGATASRGWQADLLFGLFWPIYVLLDWKNGRL